MTRAVYCLSVLFFASASFFPEQSKADASVDGFFHADIVRSGILGSQLKVQNNNFERASMIDGVFVPLQTSQKGSHLRNARERKQNIVTQFNRDWPKQPSSSLETRDFEARP